MSDKLTPWKGPQPPALPKDVSDAKEIVPFAHQLAKRDQKAVMDAFDAKNYEMAATFIWQRAVTALMRQLGSLGADFIGEMLGRPDIDPATPVDRVLTEYDALRLASELGVVSDTAYLRLRHAMELVQHFSQPDDDSDEAPPEMSRTEALALIEATVQGILGQTHLQVADEFAKFRKALEGKTFDAEAEEIMALQSSPYLYKRTTLTVLLALVKRYESGAQLEHALANVNVMLPLIWEDLKKPEKWQVGTTYSELHAKGRNAAVAGLKKALTKVRGFDFVPETLRSNTFIRAANDILAAHHSYGNYQAEIAPARLLESLGTIVPMPAIHACITAALAVYLGNYWGHSWSAVPHALAVLERLSRDRWEYYLNECLPADTVILYKMSEEKPRTRWIELVKKLELSSIPSKTTMVSRLLKASANVGGAAQVQALAADFITEYKGRTAQ